MQQGMDADAVAETFAARITLGWSIWRPANCWIKTRAIDQAQALKDPQSIALDAAGSGRIKRRSNFGGNLRCVTRSSRFRKSCCLSGGNGLWSMMYAFVALGRRWAYGEGILTTIRAKRRGWAARWKTRTGVSSLSVGEQ